MINQADIIEAFNSASRYLVDFLNIDNPYFEFKAPRGCLPLFFLSTCLLVVKQLVSDYHGILRVKSFGTLSVKVSFMCCSDVAMGV